MKKTRSRKSLTKQSARLGAYLAAGLGASTVATQTADAAIVLIDIGPSGFNIGGINAGLASGTVVSKNNFPITNGGRLYVGNYYSGYFTGLGGYGGLKFASGATSASPVNFALNSSIDSSAYWGSWHKTVFRYTFFGDRYFSESPNFGPGSYMGFRTNTGNYGWLEVTWYSKTSQFEILSGAYESVPGVAILAGDTGGSAAVPEPSTWAMSALLSGGVAFTVWRKRRQKAAQAAA